MDSFASDFRALTKGDMNSGYEPLRWQRRLFEQFCRNDIPKLCDLPTGLGKTSVIHLWLLALRHQGLTARPRLPMRLVYVVDRRTVVDQATAIAEKAKKNLKALGLDDDWLSVSTLRGQYADNREWVINPSRPAIIVGTVDMIGSRLLFSGYRSSYKSRPLDAGWLGQDTLLVLDEAHLSEPFARLIHSLGDAGVFQSNQGLPMRVMCMSATATGYDANAFKLETTDLEGDHETNPIIQRYESKKRLKTSPPGDKKEVEKKIIESAIELADDKSRVVIFVRSPDDAKKIATAIRARSGSQNRTLANAVEILTGTMRGLERDQLLEKPVLKRFLDGDERPEHRADKDHAILVSTSAGEVGFDLNADHMVCDATPLDSMIQRLGRVNRRGYGDATVLVFVGKAAEKKLRTDSQPEENPQHTFETATSEAIKCLGHLAKDNGTGAYNASPKAIDDLKKKLTKEQLIAASTPKPAPVELTEILLDAWSMTSITKGMPGPPVAPWLRGIDDDLPQTTIAWRAELGLLESGDAGAFETIFQKHRIRPHETLTTRADYVAEFLKKAAAAYPTLGETRVLLASRELTLTTINALVADPSPLRADPTLILPATFGGLDAFGMLDDKSVADEAQPESTQALKSLDVADEPRYERRPDAPTRVRLLLDRTEDGWVVKSMPGATLAESLRDLPSGPTATGLVGAIMNGLGMNVRLCQPLATDDGDVTRYLLALGARRSERPASAQALDEHVKAVEACAARIASEFQVPEPFASALRLAAKYHDEGKKTPTWQHAIRNKDLTRPLGKSGGTMNVRRLGGYRHEFGSLLWITDSTQPIADLPSEPETLDLMLHLIAVHHGCGRPHFARPDDTDYRDRKRCPQVAVEGLRRFARLQRRYGYWRLAWFENLLRCADAMASAENEGEDT